MSPALRGSTGLMHRIVWVLAGLAVLAACLVSGCQASKPVVTFNLTFGGKDSDRAVSVEQTRDGGYVFVGTTASSSSRTVAWLVKTDARGRQVWSRTFGRSGRDDAWCVQQTSDGGYVVAGETTPGSQEGDAWLRKTDASGIEVWTQTFTGRRCVARCVQQTRDGGYVLAGHRSYDVWVTRTDPSGRELWSFSYGEDSAPDEASAVQETRDGCFVVAGYVESFGAGASDALLLKLDASGKLVWSRTFGGPDGDIVTSVQQTRDGGYILAGATGSVGAGGPNAWLIKTDDSGNEVWSRTFGGGTAATDARQVSGGYVLVATTVSDTSSTWDAWLMRTDDSGKVLWSRTFGGPKWDEAWAVRQTADGGYIVAGRTLSFGAGMTDAWLIKTDSNGMVASQP